MRKIDNDDILCDVIEPCEEHDAHRSVHQTAIDDLLRWAGDTKFATLLADPPWRFRNSTGKVAPEHKRLRRYSTLSLPRDPGASRERPRPRNSPSLFVGSQCAPQQ